MWKCLLCVEKEIRKMDETGRDRQTNNGLEMGLKSLNATYTNTIYGTCMSVCLCVVSKLVL